MVIFWFGKPPRSGKLLMNRLAVDDPADLEARAVGPRIHGTAMASIAPCGDLNDVYRNDRGNTPASDPIGNAA